MSGGVDSSVAAALLRKRGFDVIGIHIKMWAPLEARANGAAAPTSRRGLPLMGWRPVETEKPETRNLKPETVYRFDGVCRQQVEDRHDAMRVAAKLDIPFQTWNFTEEYRRAVVEYMVREYAAGRTPNPDVMCNRHIKFGLFLRRALEAGTDYIATGHYVRLETRDQRLEIRKNNTGELSPSLYSLVSARDANKDQSYFLWTLTQGQLKYCLFPIGEYTKPEVRAMARKFGLPTAEKPDSQGICFIGEIDIREFLRRYISERRGRVLSTAGKAIGEHPGVEFYTIGQRQGLGIGGGIPYYVAEKDTSTNTLVVAEGPYDEKLFRRELVVADINWIFDRKPELPLRCLARIRYRQPLQRCTVTGIMKHDSCFMIHVRFDEPQRAVTPGQSVVFYQSGEMLGGGIIRET